MKRIISLLLVAAMLLSAAVLLASCDNGAGKGGEETAPETEVKSNKVNADLKEVYNKVNEKVAFDDKVSEVLTKAEDEEEMVLLQYGMDPSVVAAVDNMCDYVITMPSDYCNTFAVFVFDRELTADEITAIKGEVKMWYIDTRASALQMYMPEEYSKMAWAAENEDLVWREYDNALALIITGEGEAKDAFEAFEAAALK